MHEIHESKDYYIYRYPEPLLRTVANESGRKALPVKSGKAVATVMQEI